MTRNKKIGIILLLSPWIILMVLLITYAIVNYIADARMVAQVSEMENPTVTTFGLQPAQPVSPALAIIKVLLGFLGVLNVPYMFVGTGLGIYFLVKKNVEITKTQLPTDEIK